VLYQRGVAANNLGKFAEARTHLQAALDTARDNKHQLIRILLQLSRAWYPGGKTAPAQQYVADAIANAQASGMANLATQGQMELGKVLLHGRNYDEAEKCFKQALESARSHNERRNEAMAELSLGILRIGIHHDADGGVSFIERALAFYEPGGYRKEVSEALIYLARARCLKGDYDSALGAYEQVLQVAERIDDQALVARAHADTGNLLNQQERYPEALGHLEKSFAIYASLENHLYAGYSLADRGDAL
jgi:tetratricopeptide (TPR) repeat protein